MTKLTENSPGVRLYAAMADVPVDKIIRTVGRDPLGGQNSVAWIKRITTELKMLAQECHGAKPTNTSKLAVWPYKWG